MSRKAMTEPTFDADGYPTEATIRRIRTWQIKTMQDAADAMDFAGRAWSYSDYWTCDPAFLASEWTGQKPQRQYVFSTGGWSGNESIVGAIEKNTMLQILGAWSWRRGGHYEYRFPQPEPAA